LKYPLDVQIADILRRFFQFYIRKRRNQSPEVEEITEEEKWLNNFTEGRDFFEFILSENIKIYLYKDSYFSKLIYYSFEETEINFINSFLQPGDCFFDIGANIGLFSLHASTKISDIGCIYAFEPTPTTYERLLKNIVLNNFENIKTENIGMSDSVDTVTFYISNNGYDAWNSIVPLPELDNYSKITVNTTTIDNYIKSKLIKHVDLVKVDVIGWELKVLKGAFDLMSRDDAPVLMVEFTEENAFSSGYYCGELFDYVNHFDMNYFI
jgi:FkbM family methyltransferase